ncbi:MAG TPA: extracellular solute-binding protein [Verrucomicrobiae bacterium]|nr:extracellular solute-binding protein [Verrucomicrobiae bacterium]
MIRFAITLHLLAAVLLSLFCASSFLYGQTTESKLAWLDALPLAERQQRLMDAARKEGEITAYGNLDLAATQTIIDGFMKKYPFLKANPVRVSGAGIITRVDTEARAGRTIADVIDSGQLGMLALMDKKLFARYRSPQREFFREAFKDTDGFWTAYMTNVMVTAYNTRLVKKEEAPTKIDDLLKPRWKGKLAMDSQSYVWFGAMMQHLGEEAGLPFMKRLNEQGLRHFRGRRLGSQLIAAGEFDMTVETNLNSVLTLAAQGAPLWFAPIQPLFFSPSLLFMAQGAPHPHAGALFIDYLLSEDGQRVIASTNRMPANSRVRSKEAQMLEGLDIRMPDILDIGRRYNAIGNQYREVFPGAR